MSTTGTAESRSYPAQLAARVREVWPADARPLPTRLEWPLDVA